MRKMLWIIAVLVLLWAGWWWIAATALTEGSKRWLSSQPSGGWQAAMSGISVGGFPFSLNTRIEAPKLANPGERTAIAAEVLDIHMPAYWPGNVALALPATPVTLDLPGTKLLLQLEAGELTLNLHPGLALELEAIRAKTGPWEIRSPQGALARGAAVDAAMVQDAEAPALYQLTLTATDLTPGAALRDALALTGQWPQTLETVTLDMGLAFVVPIDRETLQGPLPLPRQITLRQLEIGWGPVRLTAEGAIAIDSTGMPEGRLGSSITQWRQIMAQAALAGLISAPEQARAELVLNALANMSGEADTLDLELRFAQGQMFLGPIPLGPAPRLVIP